MHQAARADDVAAENLPDALMPQTHTQKRRRRAKPADDITRDAGLIRRARTGRNADPLRLQRSDLLERDLIVPLHQHLSAEFAKILHQVVGEAVVVIDDQEHGGYLSSGCGWIGSLINGEMAWA